jgi:D-alanyl-D-alanine carboxypeptidase (penicillin-binding protein 5/6)
MTSRQRAHRMLHRIGALSSWPRLGMILIVSLFLAGCAGQSAGRSPSPTPVFTLTPTAPPVIHLALPPLPPAISAQAADVFDITTGQDILTTNADSERAMASTTKIATAMVAMLTGNLNAPVTVTPAIDELAGTGASVVCCPGLQVGEVFTLRDLLYAMLLPSGDDAAVVIADGVAGSESAFVARMNGMAALLGLHHTHFADVTGLDAARHYTTASDLVRLAASAMHIPLFREIVGASTYTIPASATHPAIQLQNTNLLLTGFDGPSLGVDGVKTGFTGNAGYCVVVDAHFNGHEIAIVVLDDTTIDGRFADAAVLLKWYENILRIG